MKIALVSQPLGPLDLPPGGSVEIFSYEVGRRLASQGHEVAVYGRRGVGRPPQELVGGMSVRRLGVASDNRFVQMAVRRMRWLGALLPAKHAPFSASAHFSSYAVQVAMDVRRFAPDVVHVQNFSQFVPIIRALGRCSRIVLHMHCAWLTELHHRTMARRVRSADLVIGCSRELTERHRRCFPGLAGRCVTVHNGVDVKAFRPRSAAAGGRGAVRLLFVGRLTPEKGLHVLLDAFAQVLRRHPDVRLEIVGPEWTTPLEFLARLADGPGIAELASFYDGRSYLGHLRERMSPDVTERVEWSTGVMPHDQINVRHAAADIVVNPSLSEMFPLSVLEGMASGLPIVATAVGGVAESVSDGETGLLVPPANAAALAEALIRLVGDATLRHAMGRAARRRVVEQFSWDVITSDLVDRYTEVVRAGF